MERIDVKAAVAGAAAGMAAYFVVFVIAVPALAAVLVTAGPLGAAAVILAAQALVLLLLGAGVAAVVRRRRGLLTRTSAMSTVLTAGGSGLVVVLVLGAAAAAATAAPGLTGATVLVSAVLWLGAPAAGCLLVAPRSSPAAAYGREVPPVAAGPVGTEHRRAVLAALRGDREAGAATLEGLGVTVVAALLVAALLMVMTPAGAWLGDHVRVALCRIVTLGQGDCGTAAPIDAEAHKPDEPCVLSTSNDVRDVGVDVVFVTVKGGGTIRVETMSDGTYRVSMEGSGGAGAQIGVGAGASVTIDDHVYGGEASAQLAGYVQAAGGATWVVDEEGKNKLVDYLKNERNWATVQATLSSTPLGALASGVTWAAHGVWDWITGDDYEPPSPDELYGQVGIGGTGSATAAGIVQGATAEVNAATAIGSRVDVATGATTLYYVQTVDGSASGNVGYGDNGGIAQAEGQVKVLLAVTVGKDGTPVRVSAQGLAVGDAQATASTLFTGSLGSPSTSGGSLYNASVDLTGPETRRIALDLLHATGIVPSDTVVDQGKGAYDALATFTDAARQRGVLTRQDVTSSSNTSFGIQGGGEFGPVELGGSFENSTNGVDSEKGYWWDGQGWRSWAECAA